MPRTWHHQKQRPFSPGWVINADHRGLRHTSMRHHRILDFNGTDPLPARLDHILGTVSNLQIATSIQGGDIPSIEPAISRFPTKISAAHPRTSNLQASRGFAVARQDISCIVDKPQTHTKYLAPSHDLLASLLLRTQRFVPGLMTVISAQRTGFRHPPADLEMPHPERQIGHGHRSAFYTWVLASA
ncbi:hypothetical protein PSHI_48100 [Pseudomonas sp. URMO17WK12:I11]|nr:hypothetical protein PSHI_48100 [Pseudomonas sp. URMO17WK12:I11]